MTKQNIGRFRYFNILITFVTASHTHRAQYIFLRLEYFFTRSRRNGARKRAIASADSRSRKPRRLNFHSIQWNARMTSLPSILSPRARHDRGAVPRRGANAGVQPCDAVFSASWKIFKYRNLSKTYLRSTYCTRTVCMFPLSCILSWYLTTYYFEITEVVVVVHVVVQ